MSAPRGHITYDDEECNGSGSGSGSGSDSMSRGWGSVGVYPMTGGLLGITPTGIGEGGVTIAPPDAGLTAARGMEWTQHDPVSVAWQRGRGSSGQVTPRVSVPDNMTAAVMLPVAAGHRAGDAGGPHYEGTRDRSTRSAPERQCWCPPPVAGALRTTAEGTRPPFGAVAGTLAAEPPSPARSPAFWRGPAGSRLLAVASAGPQTLYQVGSSPGYQARRRGCRQCPGYQ